jgi:hypothetical protein
LKPIRLVAVCLALVAATAACGGDEEPDAPATATATEQALATSAAPTPCSVEGASDASKIVESEVEVAVLTDVRQTNEGCPRVVFEFENSVPGYEVLYDEPPFGECGSGARIATESWDADAYLRILLQPAKGGDESGRPTYEGPFDIPVGGQVLKHMKRSCDHEAQIEWIVGLDERHDFTVRALSEPPRIVIDISESA